ncbi:hypothetical protein RIR_e54041_A0A2N0PT48_9GLOM [Rhizophagus irregularis DAOM 181602=DAOM 197198]|nr:hypothetical protein RIR_e54041_A0A2N0PT48_9GLOM [Rhizophagus irregularis DAOM 181602=DAOM 197198]
MTQKPHTFNLNESLWKKKGEDFLCCINAQQSLIDKDNPDKKPFFKTLLHFWWKKTIRSEFILTVLMGSIINVLHITIYYDIRKCKYKNCAFDQYNLRHLIGHIFLNSKKKK